MLYVAAEALAKFVSPEESAAGKVFPHINHIRQVSHRIAVAVAEEAIREGQATKVKDTDNLAQFIADKMYFPVRSCDEFFACRHDYPYSIFIALVLQQYVPPIEKREVTF
jgi:phosphoribosyl-ATP pyrophosphohydrolase